MDPTGDIVTEDLKSILASVSHGDLSLIKQLVEDQNVNIFVRNAALDSLVILYNISKHTRESLVGYIGNLLELDEDPFFIANLVSTACTIHPEELYDVSVNCFDFGIVDEFLVCREDQDHFTQKDIGKVLAELKESRQYQLINDAISDMEL